MNCSTFCAVSRRVQKSSKKLRAKTWIERLAICFRRPGSNSEPNAASRLARATVRLLESNRYITAPAKSARRLRSESGNIGIKGEKKLSKNHSSQ